MSNSNLEKLLKMKIRALEVSSQPDGTLVVEFGELALKMATLCYQELLEKISSISEHNHSLSEERDFLEEIICDYQDLNNLCRYYQKINDKYSNDSLLLPDLSMISIVNLRTRCKLLSDFLINQENVLTMQNELADYSKSLANQERLNSRILDMIGHMDKDLISLFVNSEGRIVVDGSSRPISAVEEYKNNGMDLQCLLDDEVLLNKMIEETEKQRLEAEESLNATRVCFQNSQTEESEIFLHDVTKETIKLRYKSVLLRIVSIINVSFKDYYKSITKRENLLDLIKYRETCLRDLGIELLIDPLMRIKLPEQIAKITSYKDSNLNISQIKEKINEISSRLEELECQNRDFRERLMNEYDYVSSEKSEKVETSMVSISKGDTTSRNYMDKKGSDNMVVGINDAGDDLNLRIVGGKTKKVLQRNNEMLDYPLEKDYISTSNLDFSDIEFILSDISKDKCSDSLEEVPLFVDFPLVEDFSTVEDSSVVDEKPLETSSSEKTLEKLFEDMASEPFKQIAFFDDKKDEGEESEIHSDFIFPIVDDKDDIFWPMGDEVDILNEEDKTRTRKVA